VTRALANPYEVLGVSQDADASSIKAAYRRLALRYHPDRNPGDKEAEERFKEISQAYAILRDPDARARYDHYGHVGDGRVQPDFSHVDWESVFREAGIHFSSQRWTTVRPGSNLMFEALFGVMAGLMRQSGLLPGEDRELAITVGFEEARQGALRRLRIPGPSVCASCRGSGCAECGGGGVLRGGAEVEVSVPAGVAPGSRMRLRGLGGPGNPPGDAYVRVEVSLPSGSYLEGKTVYAELPLLPFEAERGTRARVLGVEVAVPAGAKEGKTIRVPGAGIAGGDLVLKLKVGVLAGLWRKLREALG
jgi:molecular chaperone DnaJ